MGFRNTLDFRADHEIPREFGIGGPMPPEFAEGVRKSLFVVVILALTLLGALLLRLWYLQLVKGYEFRYKSEHNRLRTRDLPPWRGMIFDRQGQILVNNRPSYDLLVILEDIQNLDQLSRGIGQLLKINPQELKKKIDTAQQDTPSRTVKVKGDLSWEELALVETYKYELPGILIQVQPKREYRSDALACHLIGYLGEITEAQLKSNKFPQSKMGDSVGKCGVELAWEKYLTGRRGSRQIEVDALGRELRLINQAPSNPGANLYLTLDSRLQRVAQDVLKDKYGAVVALEPQTGKILAMASSPTFDLNAFEKGISHEYWKGLIRRKDHPLENRVVKGQYPPASIFKIVMLVAGLEEKVINPASIVSCKGDYPCGNHVFHCHRRRGHGKVNAHRALVQSCDIFFYDLGQKLGIERIAKWSQRFGLGQPTGVNLDNEKGGAVPSTAWKNQRYKQPWHDGDTLSVAIGQGYNLATPLQMARVAAAITNGGIIHVPRIVDRIESPDGEIISRLEPEVASTLQASPKTLELVRQAMRGVVHERSGTGHYANIAGMEVGGKTGTAQVVALGKEGGRKTKDHAWFVAFAPLENSKIAVAVIIEHGGNGGDAAAPIAQEVMAAYLKANKETEATDLKKNDSGEEEEEE
jgi:penicillin-binding protein 2